MIEAILISGPKNALDVSVGSARTCYSSKIVSPEKTSSWSKKTDLAKDLYKAGHHTTLQHTHFTFMLSNVSRLSVWRFFHSHRFYNSDQQSQRYVKIDGNTFYIPDNMSDKDKNVLQALHQTLSSKYNEICEILEKDFQKSENRVERNIANKKAMENARYIFPQNVKTNLYHTVNLSTLLRYYSVKSSIPDATQEIEEIVEKMIESLLVYSPELKPLFDQVDLLDRKEVRSYYPEKEIPYYDGVCLKNNSCHQVLPEKNKYSFYMNEGGVSALFNQPESEYHFTFDFAISLSADAQDQRHRAAMGVRPVLMDILKEINKKDFENRIYVPDAIEKNDTAKKIYFEAIWEIYKVMQEIESVDYKPYLIPNGFKIMVSETNNFQDFVHKAQKRLCLNSQEEIRRLTENMVNDFNRALAYEKHPLLVPPCVMRFKENVRPYCPEGDRFCGIKEWKKEKYSV